ncbi:MAG: putative glycogen debranching enzyme [Planctomycetota bacterium]|jgi:predicted glycogen debranching enzyme
MPALSTRASILCLSSDRQSISPQPDPSWITSEWLETDGLGGYATCTALGVATRRYHGWLTVVPDGCVQRHLLLARFDETVTVAEQRTSLGVASYGDELASDQLDNLQSFSARPWPCTDWSFAGVAFRRELLLVAGRRTLLVRYSASKDSGESGDSGEQGESGIELSLRPLFPFRESDQLTIRNDALDPNVRTTDFGFCYQPYESLPEVELHWGDARAEFLSNPAWYQGITYERDKERGFEFTEDHPSPGRIELTLKPGESVVIAVSIDELGHSPEVLWERETRTRTAEVEHNGGPQRTARISAHSYFYRRKLAVEGGREAATGSDQADGTRLGILAGFPWFGEWGRDAFIALPGLTLARGRVKECEEVLLGALPFVRGGLLPNIFGSSPGDSHYGSADASLWFARAVRMWAHAGADKALLSDTFLPALEAIAEGYSHGDEARALGLFVDEEGLLHAGRSDLSPTWMDALIESGPVTPRVGRPVELNALWYGLLALIEELNLTFRNMTRAKEYGDRRRLMRRHFMHRFWVEDEHYLADVIRDDGTPDLSVRPNMLIAAAEAASPLRKAERRVIVERSRAELLTPFGLRTLSPADPAYIGRYEGGPQQRDAAYHQGTAWPWLLGFHIEADLRAFGSTRARRDELSQLWAPLETEIASVGMGHIAEVYDGEAPQRAGGSFAQAWSLGEYLRSTDMLSRKLR